MPAPVDISDPFRALSDPTRREIVSLLVAGPLPVRMIASRFPSISRPAVSKHLRILREGNLVDEERSGRERFYSLNRESLASARDWLSGVTVAKTGSASGRKHVPPPIPEKAAKRDSLPDAASRGDAVRPGVGTRVDRTAPPEPDDWKSW